MTAMNCLNCGSPEWVRSAPTGGIEHVVFECGDSASIFPDGQALKSPSAGVDPNGPACRIIADLREQLRTAKADLVQTRLSCQRMPHEVAEHVDRLRDIATTQHWSAPDLREAIEREVERFAKLGEAQE